jgi:phosphoribosylformylglycinamidine cyclo-ligase
MTPRCPRDDLGAWRVPPIFEVLQHLGAIAFDEMLRVFNMGLGLIFVAADTLDPRKRCPGALPIGRVVARQAERVIIDR